MAVDPSEMGALVGRWARLRPTDAGAVDDGRRLHAVEATAARQVTGVEVAVVSSLDRVLRCETRDRHALALAGRPVLVELGGPEAMLRVAGSVRVLVEHPLPVVLAVAVTGELEHLQRRQWVRARVQVPVEVVTDAVRGTDRFRATTVDLSAGGARLKTAEPLERGEALRLTLWIPGGPVEVDSIVLDPGGDGTARVAFDAMAEAVGKRLMRFVFDVQVRNHRLAET